ncbi:DUF3598 family protein [Microseira wollei]|uniref:DUF3598 domain-containing protein n=1 Tax=Microseira wollei NIES-4236 TaxID=2530354 RepID=A0AAV3XQ14_9CYAN|nr:DUF3598 family protein [Microseira wollei]GET41727.1 hypothetical protein MiSe_65410 [Microseira wollei NIES-4236]
MKKQWECVLENLGEWEGSFTHLSPQGELIDDIPSVISLTGVNENQTIHLALRRYYPTAPGSSELKPQELAFDFSAPSSGALFFEMGAFSEGSPYFATGTLFGAEFGFKESDRRMRLIQQFDAANSQLFKLTLVRERRVGTTAPERPPLALDDFLGEWEGEAVTLYPDGRPSVTANTSLKCDRLSENQLVLASVQETDCPLKIAEDSKQLRLNFEQNSQQYQILLLPDGAASTCPTQITPGNAFFMEVSWLIQPRLRQRMIRTYDDKGKWDSLTLVTEQR